MVHRPMDGIAMYTCWPGWKVHGRAIEMVTLTALPGSCSTRTNVPPEPKLRYTRRTILMTCLGTVSRGYLEQRWRIHTSTIHPAIKTFRSICVGESWR